MKAKIWIGREGEIDIIGDGRPNLATCIMDPSGRKTD